MRPISRHPSCFPLTRRQMVLATVLLAATLTLSPAIARAAEQQIIRIATASKAGTFYPIGTLIAAGMTGQSGCEPEAECGVAGVIAVAQVSNGSVANVEALSSGTVEAGLAQADVIYWAHTGTGRFAGREPLRGFVAVANLYPGSLHVVARADSGIRGIQDLRGKRVALDEPGSGTLATAELILATANISKADLSPLYIKHNHAGPKLAQDQLDAFFFVAGFPTRSVLEVSAATRIALLPLPERTIHKLLEERPYFTRGTIPAGTYPKLDQPVPTVNIGTQLIVREDLGESLVYALTRAMWNQRTRSLLDEGHPKGSQVRLETAVDGVSIPLHPGAARFYREAGLKVP